MRGGARAAAGEHAVGVVVVGGGAVIGIARAGDDLQRVDRIQAHGGVVAGFGGVHRAGRNTVVVGGRLADVAVPAEDAGEGGHVWLMPTTSSCERPNSWNGPDAYRSKASSRVSETE
ncbi:hypothetical protein G6F35_016819 [Rhizopus arrhizus]|nr:hypothetical protein G6F35_016819 [Rhizopus arrhizus]